jgi:hypothetical protein
MVSSKPATFWFQNSLLLLIAILVVSMFLVSCTIRPMANQKAVIGTQFEPDITPHTVTYRYEFGGEILTHYLNDVVGVTLYLRPDLDEPLIQAAFNLSNGWDYVINGDMLVDFELPLGDEITQIEKINQSYHHYDPYLQGYKQNLHEIWVDEQYSLWAGREATEEEWLEAINELTRGVEHHQMAHWIQYSPESCRYYLEHGLEELLEREPTEEEKAHVYQLLLDGAEYEDIESILTD